VETSEQMTFLQQVQCSKLQGYLFSPPVPAEEMEPMLRRGHIRVGRKEVIVA
jgi:EAL domain-containing protein (putative c-di-GMP-specific phosphodiesterase class I)